MSEQNGFPLIGRILYDWRIKYDNFLSVHKDDIVTLGSTDPVWSDWQWCTDIHGNSGWMPVSLIDCNNGNGSGKMLRDFDTRELGVSTGEEVKLHKFESGWYWASNRIGQKGWIPALCVRVII